MHKACRQWIAEILRDHASLVALAARQRAKFEGWLKFELAAKIEKEGAQSVEVEASFDGGRSRSDITFYFDDIRYDLELKTPNTNYRIEGIENKHRPITKNIAAIIKDAHKLQDCPDHGIVAFVLFPIPQGSTMWLDYLARIAGELNIDLSESQHCTRVNSLLGAQQCCEIVVCCFSYPQTI